MKRTATLLLFLALLLPAAATPDRGVWVIDTLVGVAGTGVVIRQYVLDTLGSHFQNRVQTFLVEKELKTNKVRKIVKIADYTETADLDTGEMTRDGRAEAALAETLRDHPELFYGIDYVFPIGLPNGHRERSRLVNGDIVIRDYDGTDATYPLGDYIKLDAPPVRIIQEYARGNWRILLVEFGEPSYESNYYQKIIVIGR